MTVRTVAVTNKIRWVGEEVPITTKIKHKIAIFSGLLIGALPLVVYPFVLLANVMSLAADWLGVVIDLKTAGWLCFLLGSTAYPIAYALCVAWAISRFKRDENGMALGIALAPLAYLMVLVCLLAAQTH